MLLNFVNRLVFVVFKQMFRGFIFPSLLNMEVSINPSKEISVRFSRFRGSVLLSVT